MRLIILDLLVLLCSVCHSQELVINEKQSSVKFSIRNFGLSVEGTLSGWMGTFKFDPRHPEEGYFNVSILAASIDTGIDLRDKHLKKEDYFDVRNFPHLKFESQKITAHSEKSGVMTGVLTIKKKVQKISIPFSVDTFDDYYHFQSQFKINRLDFDVGEASLSLRDTVLITLGLTANKKSK
jgi:polyisoprenoid-binding protein YceI